MCLVVLFLGSLGLSLPFLDEPVGYMDEGLLLVYPQLLRDGWVMHRDFQTGYGPGGFWALLAWFELFGTSVTAERMLAFVIRASAVCLAFLLVRRWGRLPALAVAAGTFACLIVMPPRASTWLTAASLLLAALVLLLPRTGTVSAVRAVVGGVLIGLAFNVRLDTVAFAATVALPLLCLHLGRRRALLLLAGLAAGVTPLVAHIAIASPAAVFDNMFVDPVLRIAPGRALPLPRSDYHDHRRSLLLLAMLATTIIALAVLRPWRSWRDHLPAITLAVVAVCLSTYVFQRADRNHFALAMAVLLPASAYAVCAVGRVGRWAVVLLAPGVCLAAFYESLWDAPYAVAKTALADGRSVQVSHAGRTLPVPPGDAAAYRKMLDAIAALPAARTVYVAPAALLTTPYSDLQWYFLLMPGLRPAGYHFEINPGSANREGSRFASDIASADLLILGTRWDNWNEPNTSTRPGSPAAAKVVARDFTLHTDAGLFRLYTHRRLAGTTGPASN